MRSKFLSSVAGSALFTVLANGFAGGALAADLAATAPAWSWAGFYAGTHSAVMGGRTKFSDPFGSSIFGDRASTPGYGFGGQIGYNWQNGMWVYGLEADATWLTSDSTVTCGAFSGAYVSANCRARPDANGAVTGRLGLALGPAGHTLAYAKGGFAWQHSDVSATNNNLAFLSLTPPPIVTTPPMVTNSTSLTQTGWTIGAGVEQSLTPAWSVKFEYDYLNFGHHGSVVLPASFIGPVDVNLNFNATPPGTANVSSDVHMFKLGFNYKFGQDPWAPGWGAPGPAFGKAPPAAFAPGWEFEGGGRYWYSWGRFQKDLPLPGFGDRTLLSRLTFDKMTANTGEFFGRIDTPMNVYLKGIVGGGSISGGHMNDEDWGIFGIVSYSNTLADKVTGPLFYGTVDLGYDLLRGPGYKVGPFIGYNHYKSTMNASGCLQIANPFSDCTGAPGAPVEPTSHLSIIERDTWDSLRIGSSAEVMLFDRWKLTGDVAYVPYTKFSGSDHHLDRVPLLIIDESGHGRGVQAEAFLSYLFTDQLSVGVGGRYWALWTTSGTDQSNLSNGVIPRNDTFRTERIGATFQASYKFDVPK